jgi:HD superfamily phosphohydrolase
VRYWRTVVRMAALCHDLGHQPFSHAGEELLPKGEDHESITERFITSPEMSAILADSDLPITPEHVAELAVKRPGLPPWKQLLAEIIQSNFFGVDRIDYLLRDSHHAGVAYGRFDHFRLLDTVRILPPARTGDAGDGVEATPALGVERGGLESAETLLLARHYMFRQVYLHPVRRIYDKHLEDFLRLWLPEGRFGTDTDALLNMDDNRVLVGINDASADLDHPAHDPARRIVKREHFRKVFEPTRPDYRVNLDAGKVIADALSKELGEDAVRWSFYRPKDAAVDFPVLVKGEIEAASNWLEVLTRVPPTRFDAVFVAPERLAEAEAWLKANKDSVLEHTEDESDDDDGGGE